jgi:PKD repeat protein
VDKAITRILAISIVALFMVQGPLFLTAADTGDIDDDMGASRSIENKKKWTFIVFLFSDSSQHGGTLKSYYEMIENMETKGGWSDENVNVLVLQDRHPYFAPDKDGDTHAFYVQKGKGNSKEIALNEIHEEWLNEVNMASRYTLKHFGTYAIQNYPAEHYVVITRSAGWWPDNFGEDDTSRDNLNPFEMRSVMANLSTVAGKKIDVLNIAGCTSGMFEWAYDYYPYADYYVSTETYSIGSNWRIYYWINDLRKDPDMSPAEFTSIIVNEYVNEDRPGYNPYNTLTASSVDLGKIQGVASAIDNLSLAMMDDMEGHIHKIWLARDRTTEIDNYLRVDTWEWAYQISLQFPKGSKVHTAAMEVMESFDDMVLYNQHHTPPAGGINVSTARGLSLYFVRDSQLHWVNCVDAYRSRLHFTAEAHWVEFLDEYFSYIHERVTYASGGSWIDVHAGCGDVDGDGHPDDLWVEVWNSDEDIMREASIYVNGEFWGKTNDEGWFAEFNLEEGDYSISAVYNDFWATTAVHCEGAGAVYQHILEAIGWDLDQDGWKDDLYVEFHDTDWQPIPWASLYSDFGFIGHTDETGRFWGFNYPEGSHILYAVVEEKSFAIDHFYSEGDGSERFVVEPKVIDYSGDKEVNDLDLYVEDHKGNGYDGAIVYVDDVLLGETYDGRIMDLDFDEGWHWADVYYKEPMTWEGAYFKDVYFRVVDTNNDSLEETVTLYYDIETEDVAMDVKVTEQVFLWQTGELKGMAYDNHTVVRGKEEHRFLNYTTDKTRFINLTLTLTDEDGYFLDRWVMIGIWLEASQNEPPEARLFVRPTYTYVDESVCFNATTSSDPDGHILWYNFVFGDGTETGWTNNSIVNHTYAEPGNYTTYVMVMDDLGGIDETSNRITVWVRGVPDNVEPDARLFVRPTYTYPWEPVSFNGSSSEDEDGAIVMYMFNFGDGTVSGWINSSTVEHTYNKPGNYTAKLKVKDDWGAESDWSNKITVWVKDEEGNSPPHAYFTARPSKVDINETVTFNATGSSDEDGHVYKYYYDFGDGTNSGWVNDPIVTHQYSEAGYYTATLMVEDDFEALSEWSTPRGIEVVGNIMPRPYLFARPHYIDEGDEVTFNASSSWDEDGSVILYMFDFGDGTTSGWTGEPVLVHRYEKAGNFTVILYVQDDQGGISTSSSRSTVTVSAQEQATSLVESPALTVLVLVIFVVLMLAGSYYEIKKVRLKSYEAPEQVISEEPQEDVVEDPEEKDADGISAGSELEAHDDEDVKVPDGDDDEDLDEGDEPKVKTPEGRHGEGEIEAEDHHTHMVVRRGMKRIRCGGCGAVMKVPKEPRPMRVRCKSCGKKGVLR